MYARLGLAYSRHQSQVVRAPVPVPGPPPLPLRAARRPRHDSSQRNGACAYVVRAASRLMGEQPDMMCWVAITPRGRSALTWHGSRRWGCLRAPFGVYGRLALTMTTALTGCLIAMVTNARVHVPGDGARQRSICRRAVRTRGRDIARVFRGAEPDHLLAPNRAAPEVAALDSPLGALRPTHGVPGVCRSARSSRNSCCGGHRPPRQTHFVSLV